ncbi:MAG TPA: Lpg1974 family pore-forming outer membrane protein, partial [Pirellulales bacterium]|nr:Lpg1974 family pore-forming outer membrane protein [Pirellulales bacterium]
MRIAQAPTPAPPQSAPPPTAGSDSSDPFTDDVGEAGGMGPVSEDGLWQAPPSLPSACGDDCCDDCFDDVCCCVPRCSCWYGGADYLLAKPHFSQGYAAIVCQTTTNTSTSPNVSTLTENAVPFPYRYSSMYRVFLGYHLQRCGGDVNFTYWNLQSTAATTIGPAEVTNGTNVIFGQVLNNPADGQYLAASSGIRINIFDIDFSKYLIYGGGNPCDCNSCPRWDMRWFAGVRIAQVNRFDNNQVLNPDYTATAYGNVNANFYGAGPKIGLQVRRYIGAAQRLSVFAKGSGSLLLGQFHGTRSQIIPGDSTTPTSVTTAYDNTSRVIPVADIEVGGTYQL